MLRKRTWLGLLFVVVFMPSTILAQGMMHGKWWHDSSIVQGLELTDAEKKELDEKYIESRRKMIDLKSEIEMQRFELDLLLGSKDADRQKVMTRFNSLEQVRDELSRTRFEMLLEIREIIGPERFQELNTIYRDRKRKDKKSFRNDRTYDRDND